MTSALCLTFPLGLMKRNFALMCTRYIVINLAFRALAPDGNADRPAGEIIVSQEHGLVGRVHMMTLTCAMSLRKLGKQLTNFFLPSRQKMGTNPTSPTHRGISWPVESTA